MKKKIEKEREILQYKIVITPDMSIENMIKLGLQQIFINIQNHIDKNGLFDGGVSMELASKLIRKELRNKNVRTLLR